MCVYIWYHLCAVYIFVIFANLFFELELLRNFWKIQLYYRDASPLYDFTLKYNIYVLIFSNYCI